ncbi:MAG TPA: cupin domain-containing protein [Caulobacteraceae bacterium]
MTENIRRIVTTHDDRGAAIVLSDTGVAMKGLAGADAKSAVVWTTGSVPADNLFDDAGDTRDAGASLKDGSVLRVTEFGPGFVSPMHRTLSIDYAMVLSGVLEMELDSGAVVSLRPGDTVVQRGGAHLWRNPSPDTPCRILICMIEAQPVVVDGRTLKQTPTWRMLASLLQSKLSRGRIAA